MQNKLIQKLISPFLKKYYSIYANKKHTYRYNKTNVIIYPGVFSPRFTFATKVFVKYLQNLNLKDKSFLELGCGNGIASIEAFKKGAQVYSSDINPLAIKGIEETCKQYNFSIQCIESDLFENIPNIHFDYIYINPPFFAKDPNNISEEAWFCGKNYEYFIFLFKQLDERIAQASNVLMIISNSANIYKIMEIAKQNNLDLEILKSKKTYLEELTIYRISRNNKTV